MSEWYIYWSGAAHRAGRAPSLTSYRGHSSLHRPETRAPQTTLPWLASDDARRIEAQRAYQGRPEVKAKRRTAHLKRHAREARGTGQ